MNGFIDRLIQRHNGQTEQVLPQLRGKFEPGQPGQGAGQPDGVTEILQETKPQETVKMEKPHSDPFASPVPSGQPDRQDRSVDPERRLDQRLSTDPEIKEPERRSALPSQSIERWSEKPAAVSPITPTPVKILAGKSEMSLPPIVKEPAVREKVFAQPEAKREPATTLLIVPDKGPSGFSTGDKDPKEVVAKAMNQQSPASLQQNTGSARPAAPPLIQISIGRIEIQAISPSSGLPEGKKKTAEPELSLKDFLQQRNTSQQ